MGKRGLTSIDHALFEDNAIGGWTAVSYEYECVSQRGYQIGDKLEYGASVISEEDTFMKCTDTFPGPS